MGTISKALSLLSYFSSSKPEIGLIDFKELSGQDKATVHRHLTELEANGFLEQNLETRKYRLGGALLRLSAIREETFPAVSVVSYWVEKLALEIRELVHASLIQGTQMSPLCFHDASTSGTRVNFDLAEMLPMHATASGLAALAFGPTNLLEKTLSQDLKRYTDFTPTTSKDLCEIVDTAQKAGFSYVNQGFESEVCAVSVPFYDKGQEACGTIAVAVPKSRIDNMNIKETAQKLWGISQEISIELGGSVPSEFKRHINKAA